MISSSRGTVEQQQQQQQQQNHSKRGGSVCTVNTEFQDAVLPDLNIAHVPSADDDVVPVQRLGNGERELLERQAVTPSAAGSPSPSWLPEGWISESRIRADGHRDKYYIESYTGRRFRSKVEVFKYLETGVPPARWKRKGKAIDAIGASHIADTPRSSDQQRESLGLFGAAANSSRSFGTGADFFVARSLSTSSGVSASDAFKSSQAAFHSLRDVIMNGVTPPPPAASFPLQRSYEEEETAAKKPVFFDYWASTLGTGSGVTNLVSTAQRSSSSWTENYKVGSTFLNGMASSVPSFSSKTTHQTSEATTPHWLDRILNKPPPAPISQPCYSFGLTGGFVQSPLHYLQNAGAFQNNWLNLKPPSAITQSDYEVPWKSRSWFDRRDTSPADRLERSAINLNHPLVDPEEEARAHYQSEFQGDHRQNHEFPSRKSDAASSRSLENLWKKAVPITLEHREFVAYSNGSNATNSAAKPSKSSHHHSHHHQHHHHQSQQQQQQQQKSEVGVKRGGQKIDRYQEKKRLERLGTRLCEQGLARLVRELKDGKRGIDLN